MAKQEIERLEESIPTNSVKIIELYNKIDHGLLNTQPYYQRKLVWKKQHKYAFIETILLNFPFPEVYIASSEIDVEHMLTKEVVVDGQQRLTTIVEYIKGEGDFSKPNRITAFSDLSTSEKKGFLTYKVSVKDLKDLEEASIKEIFQRINNTEYSLNTVEKNNAQYGDGEIALFCKQLISRDYTPTEHHTDIIIESEKRDPIIGFFEMNEIFSENDKKRMYDFQYLMLIISTILEGNYYGRSSKVDEYLEKFNSSFPEHDRILKLLLKVVNIFERLDFSKKSYWYNKANLFTLIIELSKIETEEIDFSRLERELLNLEDKVDIYFTAEKEEEIQDIKEDERKYFELARHGSHEKAARDHRGRTIQNILKISRRCDLTDNKDKTVSEALVDKNIKFLTSEKVPFVLIIPTKTGLKKSIIDAVSEVRDFLRNKQIHDYENQELGPDHKVILPFRYLKDATEEDGEMSLYRSNGRGDYRIWFGDLGDYAEPEDNIALIYEGGVIKLVNISKINYEEAVREG